MEELADLGNKIERVLSVQLILKKLDNKACPVFIVSKKGDIFEQNLNILPKNAIIYNIMNSRIINNFQTIVCNFWVKSVL